MKRRPGNNLVEVACPECGNELLSLCLSPDGGTYLNLRSVRHLTVSVEGAAVEIRGRCATCLRPVVIGDAGRYLAEIRERLPAVASAGP